MSALLASTVSEHYEVLVADTGAWTLKSLWRDFNVAWVVACAGAGPVRIIRATYGSGGQVERRVVAELRVAHQHAEDRAEESKDGSWHEPARDPHRRYCDDR
jgi:hypothetical protein